MTAGVNAVCLGTECPFFGDKAQLARTLGYEAPVMVESDTRQDVVFHGQEATSGSENGFTTGQVFGGRAICLGQISGTHRVMTEAGLKSPYPEIVDAGSSTPVQQGPCPDGVDISNMISLGGEQ